MLSHRPAACSDRPIESGIQRAALRAHHRRCSPGNALGPAEAGSVENGPGFADSELDSA